MPHTFGLAVRAGCGGGKTSVLLRVKSAPDASNTAINDSVKRGDATVPFGQCGSVANELDGMRVHLSDRSSTWRIVGVEDAARIGRRAQEEPEGGS
jgi:hypothetical protein